MRKLQSLLFVIACLLAATGMFGAVEVDANRYLDHIKFLASPQLKGRGTGTPELEKAATYIAGKFREFGLKAPDTKGYLQPFPVTTRARLGPNNSLEYRQDRKSKKLREGENFRPFNFSGSGQISGPVVFAGYGITASEYNYDDYAGIDVKGKIVLILRHEPQEQDDKSVFAGKRLTAHSMFWTKAVNAKQRGAAGVILINDRHNHRGQGDQMEEFGRVAGPADAGIVFVQIKASTADRWLAKAGYELREIEAAIDKDLKPRSFALPDSLQVTITADLRRDTKIVHNVAAYLPGTTPEYLIIGAHYDHIGLGEQFSMAPSQAGWPHLGADDNASGTAGLLELARWFSKQPKQKRGILFLAFAGEELGLLGSRHYADNPYLPLKDAVAMINLDMIGRIRDNKVYVGGTATGDTFQPLINELIPKHSLAADTSGSFDSGASDHASFIAKDVPVLFFFSGLHSDYHKPSDTWDKINASEAARFVEAIGEVATALVNSETRPIYSRPSAHEGAPVSGTGQGYGPYLGTVPDFGENPLGLRLADVREDSPAHKAGLRGGDILTEFDGKKIQNLYDLTYALRSKEPGDVVRVKVLRGGAAVEATVTLAKRN